MTKTESKPAASPEDLLKAAVAGRAGLQGAPEAASAGGVAAMLGSVPAWLRLDARALGVAGGALALGAVLGSGLTALSRPSRDAGDSVIALGTTLDASRIETARLSGEVAQLHQALTDLRTAADAARKEAGTRSAALGERLGQVDRTLGGKIVTLGDRFEQAEREQTARIANLATLLDRRPAAPAPVARAEPAQTGSIADTKAAEAKPADRTVEAKAFEAKTPDSKAKPAASDKPPVIDGWAVRDVYDGTAILENRRRRLVEVAPGDTLPGVGRVEGVERHGRDWVVVTRQGIVTAQPW